MSPSSLVLAIAAVSLATSSAARPLMFLDRRDVGVVNCMTTYFASSTTASLWANLTTALGEVQLGVTRGDLLDRKEDAGAGSSFAFETCDSPFMPS